MKKVSALFAALLMGATFGAFAQGVGGDNSIGGPGSVGGNGTGKANGTDGGTMAGRAAINSTGTAGDGSMAVGASNHGPEPGTGAAVSTGSSASNWTSTNTGTTSYPVSGGTQGQPIGRATGMAGSGPGVPANANGMGTIQQ